MNTFVINRKEIQGFWDSGMKLSFGAKHDDEV